MILFHLDASVFGMRVLPGGYIGVDIFFVISGYLITRIIHDQINENRYSIVDFYVRRARRIFPALFVVMGVTAVFVTLYCLPDVVQSFEDSLIAATLFVSNIFFYLTADYFAPAAETQPLLHTWSLAVEEQFYIFFPLVLLAIRRYSAIAQRRILLCVGLLSLMIASWLLWQDATAAFYLLISRAWELMVGVLLALGIFPPLRRRLHGEILVWSGLALIGIGLFFYSDSTPFPGPAALLPCLGAAFIIHGGCAGAGKPDARQHHRQPWASRLLALPPARFVGLISYSLYLWHWPVFVLMQFMGFWYMFEAETRPYKLLALVLTFLLATLSYFLVEQPFRRPGAFRFGRKQTLALSAAAMAVLVLAAPLLSGASARVWNLPPDVARVLAAVPKLDSSAEQFRTCFLTSRNADFDLYDRDSCLALDPDRPNVIVVGDSQANDLMVGLRETYPDIHFLQATASGCMPLIEETGGERRCRRLMDFVLSDFLPRHQLDGILLSARWEADHLGGLRKTVQALSSHGAPVTVFGPRVEYKHDLPWVLAVSMLQHDPSLIGRNRKDEQHRTDRLFATGLAGTGARYFSLYGAICADGECRTTAGDGTPLAYDYGHFTRSGSIFVAEKAKVAGNLVVSNTLSSPRAAAHTGK